VRPTIRYLVRCELRGAFHQFLDPLTPAVRLRHQLRTPATISAPTSTCHSPLSEEPCAASSDSRKFQLLTRSLTRPRNSVGRAFSRGRSVDTPSRPPPRRRLPRLCCCHAVPCDSFRCVLLQPSGSLGPRACLAGCASVSLIFSPGYSAESCGYCKDESTGRRTANSRESISELPARSDALSLLHCRGRVTAAPI
jgi:hypothetical protein